MTKRRERRGAQLLRELEADPERRLKRENEILQLEAADRRAEAPLVRALKETGVEVGSVWDLVNSSRPYPEAVPLLVEHLRHAYPERVLEGIARALAVPDARPFWHILADMFRTADDPTTSGIKAALACALSASADESVVDALIDLISDTNHGGNRILLVAPLARSRRPEAVQALESLRNDPDLKREIAALGRPRKRSAHPHTRSTRRSRTEPS